MDYLDKYIQRLEKKGQNSTEATINSTKSIVSKTFKSSPSYTLVKINNLNVDAIVNSTTQHDEKEIFFMPDYNVNIGNVVEYDTAKYLILEFFDNAAYPKGKMKLCNVTLNLTGTATKTQVGVDNLGRPVFQTVYGSPLPLPCVAETVVRLSSTDNQAVNLPEGRMKLTIPYTVHSDIQVGKVLSLYSEQYQIKTIDQTQVINGVGVLVLYVDRVVTT